MLGMLLVFAAGAVQLCEDKAGSVVQIGVCQQKAFAAEDARLNRIYRKLIATLPTSRRTLLRNSERQWIKRRDDQCENDDVSIDVRCLTSMTRERADALERMAR